MPILKGWKGVGKSIIITNIITPLLGDNNVKPVPAKMVKADFNSWQLDTQLVAFHELKLGKTRKETEEMTESIKEFITEPTLLAHRKGIDAYKVINKSNAFGVTNHEDAIVITEDERRFVLIRIESHKKDSKYYIDLCKWLDSNIEEMYDYFLERNVEDFNIYDAPETEYTKEIKEQSLTWPTSIIKEALNDPDHQFNKIGIMTWTAIVAYVRSQSIGRDTIIADNLIKATSSQGYKLSNALKDLGFRKCKTDAGQDRIMIDKKLHRVWVTPGKNVDRFNSRRVGRLLHKEKVVYDFDED